MSINGVYRSTWSTVSNSGSIYLPRLSGILGMAFKGGTDDIRSSLSYELKRILSFKARTVLCTDPYVSADAGLRPLEEVLEADLLVISAPHP